MSNSESDDAGGTTAAHGSPPASPQNRPFVAIGTTTDGDHAAAAQALASVAAAGQPPVELWNFRAFA